MSKEEICERKTSKRKFRMKKMSAEYVILFFNLMDTGKFFRSVRWIKRIEKWRNHCFYRIELVNSMTERKRIFYCLHLVFSLKTAVYKRLNCHWLLSDYLYLLIFTDYDLLFYYYTI